MRAPSNPSPMILPGGLAVALHLFTLSAHAAPDPGNSSVEPWDTDGYVLVSPGASIDDVIVTVRDDAGNPVESSTVEIDFSDCQQLCIDTPLDGLTGITDAQGEVTLDPRVGGCEPCIVSIMADGVVLRQFTSVKSPDWSGSTASGTVDNADADYVVSQVGTSDFCADLNGSGGVDAADLAFLTGFWGDANDATCVGQPSAGQSSVEPWDTMGHAFMSPGTSSGVDLVTVTVKDSEGSLVAGSAVSIDVSNCAKLCVNTPDGLSGVTDSQGEVTLDPQVGGCEDCSVWVMADGVPIREFLHVASTDWNGCVADGVVDPSDFDYVYVTSLGASPLPCADLDGDGDVDNDDVYTSFTSLNSGDFNAGTFCTAPDPDSLQSTFTQASGFLVTCPAGDGFFEIPYRVTLRDALGLPLPCYPESSIGLSIDPFGSACSPSHLAYADGPTDDNGSTTITSPGAIGGQSDVSNVTLSFGAGIPSSIDWQFFDAVSIRARSPDITGDLEVDSCDYNLLVTDLDDNELSRIDFDDNGTLGASDLTMFASHLCHRCASSPPFQWESEGEIGVYFDAAGTLDKIVAPLMQPFTFYIVVRGIQADLAFSNVGIVIPPQMDVLGHVIHPLATADLCGEPNCFVPFGESCIMANTPVAIVEYTAQLTEAVVSVEIALNAGLEFCNSAPGPTHGQCGSSCTPRLFDVVTAATVTSPTSASETIVPNAFALRANRPNPFNAVTTIEFELPADTRVDMDILDISGHRVRALVNGQHYPAGRHQVVWRGRDEFGRDVASGVYVYRIRAGTFEKARWMTLVK